MMLRTRKSTGNQRYEAICVVSPLEFGDDKKDQDRATWDDHRQVACVCDGVSASPDCAIGAQIVSSRIASIFDGDIHDGLRGVSELLLTQRQRSLESGKVILPPDTPPAMQTLLKDIIQEKRTYAFQTTAIAGKFEHEADHIAAHIIACGDSALFAFSPQSKLLFSTLAMDSKKRGHQNGRDSPAETPPDAIVFGPGEQVLVEVEGPLTAFRELAKTAGIQPRHRCNWMVCAAVRKLPERRDNRQRHFSHTNAMWLSPNDKLLVPRFLNGAELGSKNRPYFCLSYSTTIQSLSSEDAVEPIADFSRRGTTTKVLPDHFYTGGYSVLKEPFPKGTQFLLCSDGLYSSFTNWAELATWLRVNETGLADPRRRDEIMTDLHSQLTARRGDDDISFVWVRPNIITAGGDEQCLRRSWNHGWRQGRMQW